MYVYSQLGSYGLIGTYDELMKVMQGIAVWELSPGTHRIQKPMAFCVSEMDVGRIISAVESRASYKGWSIDSVEVKNCTLGDPPGQQVIFTITVPEVPAFRAAPIVRAQLPRMGDRPYVDTGAEPTVTEDVGGALVEETEKKTPTWVYVVGGVAVVGVVGGIIYMVTR